MANISVCAECFFTDIPFEDRVSKIADIGYKFIEFWHPEGTFNGCEIDFTQPKNAASMNTTALEKRITYNDFALNCSILQETRNAIQKHLYISCYS